MICSAEERCAYIEFEAPLSSVNVFLHNLGIGRTLHYGVIVDRFHKDPQSQSMIRFSLNGASVRGNVLVTMTKPAITKAAIDWYY